MGSDRKVLDWAGDYRPDAPISPGWTAGGLYLLSGQIPRHPDTGAIAERNIVAQTEQVMDNLKATLSRAGLSLSDIIRCTCYVTSQENFKAFNEVYARRFSPPYPSRTTLIVALANPDYLVEIDAIAAGNPASD